MSEQEAPRTPVPGTKSVEILVEDIALSGILWLLNTSVLHPRGLALGIDTERPDVLVLFANDGTEPVVYSPEMHPEIDRSFQAFESLVQMLRDRQ